MPTRSSGSKHWTRTTRSTERVCAIYKDPQHYIHDKPSRNAAHHTKQYKKRLLQKCLREHQEGHHRWTAHRSGYQCEHCSTRVHQGLTDR